MLLPGVAKNTVLSSLRRPQEVTKGMEELMDSSCAKSCSIRSQPIFKALKPTDGVGGRGYIELVLVQFFYVVSINKRIPHQGHWINPTNAFWSRG